MVSSAGKAIAEEDVAAFPSKYIRIVVGAGTGGTLDPLVRDLAENAQTILGQKIIVENKPSAGFVLPAIQMNASPADGYTLAVLMSGIFRSPYRELFKGDPTTDLTYIIATSSFVYGLAVPSDSAIKTFADYVAFAKANPGAMNYASPGMRTIPHMVMEEIQRAAGIKLTHIPFKGSLDSQNALLAGHVQSVSDASSWAPFVESGQFRLIALYGANRLARYPDTPTLKELGYNIVDTTPWV